MPVLYANSAGVGVQVPWEQEPGDAQFRIDLPSSSPFRQNSLVSVGAIAPNFEPLDTGQNSVLGIKIVKGDFSGLVTEQPNPGDIVHLLMTGLGRVEGQPHTGVPAPSGAVMPMYQSIACRFEPWTSDAETLFAGLAPAMIGIYQVTFRLPSEPRPGALFGVQCQMEGASFGFAWFQVPP